MQQPDEDIINVWLPDSVEWSDFNATWGENMDLLSKLLFSCVFSAADMGELLQREVGHQGAGHLHRWQTAGPRPHHHHGHRADLQG